LKFEYGSQTIHGVPSCREEQAEFASQHGIRYYLLNPLMKTSLPFSRGRGMESDDSLKGLPRQIEIGHKWHDC
jgi:hypothetical protein